MKRLFALLILTAGCASGPRADDSDLCRSFSSRSPSSAQKCEAVYLKSSLASSRFENWSRAIEEYHRLDSTNGFPSEAARDRMIERIIAPFFDVPVPERGRLIASLLPTEMARKVLDELKLDAAPETFLFTLSRYVTPRGLSSQTILKAFQDIMDPAQGGPRISKTTVQILSPEQWLKELDDYKTRPANGGYSQLARLIAPFVGISYEGRTRFLTQVIGDPEKASDVMIRVPTQTGNADFVYGLSQAIRQYTAVPNLFELILKKIELDQRSQLQSPSGHYREPWTD